MDWREAMESFLAPLSPRTRERYRAALEEFAAWHRGTFGEAPDPALLTDLEVRDYVAFLQGARKLSPSSIHLRLSALRGLLRSLGRSLRVKGPRTQKPPVRALSARELGRLLAAAEGEDWIARRNAAILQLMARAGLRVGEVIALEAEDIRLGERSGWAVIRSGKGNKRREVPLNAEVRAALRAYLEARPPFPSPRLFVSRTGAAPLGPGRAAPGGGAGPEGADRGEGHPSHPPPHLRHPGGGEGGGHRGPVGPPGPREPRRHLALPPPLPRAAGGGGGGDMSGSGQ
jgi:integrase